MKFSDTEKIAKRYNIQLSRDEVAASVLPSGEGAVNCYVWLKEYFGNCGDDQPNRNQIHLDHTTKLEIYDEYVFDLRLAEHDDRSLLSYSSFVNDVWNTCFPYVRIREYKACSGKCEMCCRLSILMRKHKTIEAMRDIRDLRALHRIDFMADRLRYKERINQAINTPGKFISIITDGMQQFHTELPYFGNNMGIPRKVKQHLQGLTIHGKRTRLYRTVDHIKLGANACIYIFLLALDEELQASGSLPGTLYVQLDGGPENANYCFLAWMEILIAIDIGIEEIWLCRMRVGHTHADQDARFGQIWLYARNKYLVTPQEYNYAIKDALKDFRKGEIDADGSSAELIDIFVVPDLKKAIKGSMDRNLSKAFKKDNSQLVFRFQKVDVTERFPLGSKCTYRASALDRFVEFVPDPNARVEFSPRNVFVDWYPKEGTSFLERMPDISNFSPQPFDGVLVKELHESISVIKRNGLISLSPEAVHDWEIFEKMLPHVGETAEKFVERSGMPIPSFLQPSFLKRKKNPNELNDSLTAQNNEMIGRFQWMPSVSTGASMRSRFDLKPEAARVNLEDRSSAIIQTQKNQRITRFLDANGEVITSGNDPFTSACI